MVGEVNNPQNSTSGVFGFGAGRRHLTLSNVANGGAYDDTSGVALTMGEYQALLRWYDANHTYPSKTLKVALLDASAGRAKDGTYLREGAKYYAKNLIPQGPQGQYAMFAQMNANGMSYPAYHLGTQYFWNNLAERRRRPVAHVHHGHAVGAERALPGHGRRLAGREHRGEQRRDRAVRREPPERGRPPASRSRARSTTARFRRRTRCATTTPARRRSPDGGRVPQTPYVPAYTAAEQAHVLAGSSGGDGRRGAGVLATEDERRAFWNLGIPGFTRRRRPGLEHRREPVRVDGLRRRSGRRRSCSTPAAARRSSSRATCRRPG